jgi:hypothetical protein
MGIVTYTVIEATIAAFIVWRVVGVGWMLAVVGWRSYRDRQRAKCELFAEELAFRVRCGMYPNEAFRAFQAGGFTTDEAITAFRRMGQ